MKRYFDEVDILAASAGGSGDVNQFAAGVLGQDPTKGGGVSDLASSQRHVRDAIAQIAAPAPCKDHQRQTLALMDDGSTMLDELTRAIAANDQARMVTIASRARTLQERARAIAQLAADVKEKYRL